MYSSTVLRLNTVRQYIFKNSFLEIQLTCPKIAKAVLRGKFITQNVYITKEKCLKLSKLPTQELRKKKSKTSPQ